MILKLGGEAKDKIKTAAIATAIKKDTIATHALATAYYAFRDTAMGRNNGKSTPAYVKSAVGEDKKTYRNMELPRHSALMPSRCPEDSMGGDIVEGPVVFLARPFPRGTEAGARSRQASARGFIWVKTFLG